MLPEENRKTPWHHEPYVWLIISLPLTAVLAGIITMFLAIKSDDGLVVDDYYKKGLEVNRVLERDRAALRNQLSAQLILDPANPELSVVLDSNPGFNYPDKINISFLHPTRKGMDQYLILKRSGEKTYTGTMPRLSTGKWYVLIESESWRLFMNYSVR